MAPVLGYTLDSHELRFGFHRDRLRWRHLQIMEGR